MNEKAVVLLSGGQDSATCLAIACNKYDGVHALSIHYGQRHALELEMAATLCALANVPHTILDFRELFQTLDKTSTMVVRPGDARSVFEAHPIHQHLPSSFLPGRNYLLLGMAAVFAFNLNATQILTGVCQTDFSGYPDCRRPTIDAIENALRLALDFDALQIRTPLMFLTKAETVQTMQRLGHLGWYEFTQTCYNGKRPPCGTCPACVIRAKGFSEAGIPDPLLGVVE